MTDKTAFGLGVSRTLELQPGEETAVRAESEVSRLRIGLADGGEISLTIGPNEVVHIRQGASPITIMFEDAGVSVHDPLKEAE